MKRSIILGALLCLFTPLFGRAFLGMGQGTAFTTVELGTLAPTYSHSLGADLPLVHSTVSPWGVNMTMLYRTQRLAPVVVGIGVKGQLLFQTGGGVAVNGGGVLSLSYETFGGNLVLFVEGALLSPCYGIGAVPLSDQTKSLARQPVRGGVRWVL